MVTGRETDVVPSEISAIGQGNAASGGSIGRRLPKSRGVRAPFFTGAMFFFQTAVFALAPGGPAFAQPGNEAGDKSEYGPIVSDGEFEAAIPPLDADSAPSLEDLDTWREEQKRAEDSAVSRRNKVPVRIRPNDGEEGRAPPEDSTPDSGKSPVNLDPSLDEPLVPLSEFDMNPQDPASSGQSPVGQQGDIAYHWRIDGLEKVTGTVTSDTMRDRFKKLSALDAGGGKAGNGAQVSARLTADRQLLTDILSASGHYDASVEPAIELPPPGQEGELQAVLKVSPGAQYHLGTIRFNAPPVEPPGLIASHFGLKTGDPIIADDVLAAEASISTALPQHGYPFVNVGQRDVLLDETEATGDYTLPVEPGPRSSFGESIVVGDPVFKPRHIGEIARFKQGELYDSRKIDDLRKALIATGLFSEISVEPRASGEKAADGTEQADLVVRQKAGPMRSIAASAGYGTGQGFRVEASWTHRNLFPPEGALILGAVGGTQEQSLGATFRRSNAGRRDRTVELAVSALHSNYDAYNAYTGRLAGRISFDSTPIWQKRMTYSYGFELLASGEESYNADLAMRRRQTYYIAALPVQVGLDTTRNLLDPVSGFRLSLKLSPEAALNGGTRFYGRGVLEGTVYQPFGQFVLAGRLRFGSIIGAERAEIAPSRRFYAGGGGSVRGFGYQQLGPKDPEGNPIGGRSLAEGSIEARYRFGDYGVVAFADGGQVYASSTPDFSDLRFGAGIGLRYYTNFGPVRIDVATPIRRRDGESRVAVYVSIGQAF
ncbi:MAG: autotransporter assembly complex family protein [Novosphingobium sp.]